MDAEGSKLLQYFIRTQKLESFLVEALVNLQPVARNRVIIQIRSQLLRKRAVSYQGIAYTFETLPDESIYLLLAARAALGPLPSDDTLSKLACNQTKHYTLNERCYLMEAFCRGILRNRTIHNPKLEAISYPINSVNQTRQLALESLEII